MKTRNRSKRETTDTNTKAVTIKNETADDVKHEENYAAKRWIMPPARGALYQGGLPTRPREHVWSDGSFFGCFEAPFRVPE